METSFGVRSKFVSVYMAFIEECEKIGWIWNNDFTRKEEAENFTGHRYNGCIFLSDSFGTKRDIPAMSFSGTSHAIDLDTDFAGAIEKAKEAYANIVNLQKYCVKDITSDGYSAQIDTNGITVGCQLVPFAKFDELVKKVTEFRKNN